MMANSFAFFGTVEASLDTKSRSVIPAEMREGIASCEPQEMQNRLYMSVRQSNKFPEIYLSCFGHGLLQRMNYALALCDDELARDIETILETTAMVRFDNAGRFSIGTQVMADLGMKDSVLFKGVGAVFEIWSPAKFPLVESKDLSAERRVFRRVLALHEGRGE